MVYFKTVDTDLDERMYNLFEQLNVFVADNLKGWPKRIIVTVENPIYIQNIRATVGITQVVAASKIIFNKFGCTVFGVDNKSWKKDVLASGKADKSLIKKFAIAKWGMEETLEQDFYDAVCIAYFGLRKFKKGNEKVE